MLPSPQFRTGNKKSQASHHGRPAPTQLGFARSGCVTYEMCCAAEREGLAPEFVRDEVAAGRMIIPANIHHLELEPIGIGVAANCKVNASVGNVAVLREFPSDALKSGADTLTDLSSGHRTTGIRKTIIEESSIPIGAVPIYDALSRVRQVEDLSVQVMLEVIEEQAEQGIDYITVHAGLLAEYLPLTKNRTSGVASRGGLILAEWMAKKHKQNFIHEHFDDICKILRKHDVVLSLANGLRSDSLADAADEAQNAQFKTASELTRKAWDYDVQVMVEAPRMTPLAPAGFEAPFYTLGPLDFGLMSAGGVSMLCYVAPSHDCDLAGCEELKQGVLAYKRAAGAVDIARGRKDALECDAEMSRARSNYYWQRQLELSA